eukprot:1394835-Amorphochlora_amoeboformis.AAC.2
MPAKELGDSTPNGVADAKDTHQEKAFKPPGALSDLSVAECIVAYVTLALIVGRSKQRNTASPDPYICASTHLLVQISSDTFPVPQIH